MQRGVSDVSEEVDLPKFDGMDPDRLIIITEVYFLNYITPLRK